MILNYMTHKSFEIKSGMVSVIATSSPVVYRDIIEGLSGKNDMLKLISENYDSIPIEKGLDWLGDTLISGDLFKKYMTKISEHVISELSVQSRDKILLQYQDLLNSLQDALFMENLPLKVNFETDLKKLLKISGIHFDNSLTSNPYGIIETILNIHEELNLKSIVVFSNVAHYLDSQQFTELSKLCKMLNLPLLLVEFTSLDNKVIYGDAEFYYIDRDFVDWY